jgi:predicted ArsR family transcriptional regulator
MMNTILTEKMMPFKELEKKIYDYVCEMGRMMIKTILESYDEQLQETRNKKELRCKGTRQTTIKYREANYLVPNICVLFKIYKG